jgi:hypothetical protein
VGTLVPNGPAGSYGLTITPTQTYDYRLVFTATNAEGLRGTTSVVVRITTGACSAAAVRGVTSTAACI